jgi:hypothetical protein
MAKSRKVLTPEEYLELSRKDVAQAVERILADFDFEAAANALFACGWKYQGMQRSPNAQELKATAMQIVRAAVQSGSRCTVLSGPLEVSLTHHDTPAVVTATLSLQPVRSSAVYVDGRVIFAQKKVPLASGEGIAQ